MTKITITGGTGNVGRVLSNMLAKQGFEVNWLTRNPVKGQSNQFYWNPAKGEIDLAFLKNCEAIIHLAGAGVADKKWTPAYKEEILNSRVQGTQLLVKTLLNEPNTIKNFISASAVGIYGTHPHGLVTEDYPAADNFLAKVCVDWEKEAQKLSQSNIPLSIVRIGIVLSKNGGFVKEIAKLANWGLAAPLGNGKMHVPWIHVEDLCSMMIFLMENPTKAGVYNGVAPTPESNSTLTKLIAKHLNKPAFLPPVPAFVIRAMMGEMGAMILSDQRISAEKILKAGFKFNFDSADKAIKQLLTQ